MTQRMRAYKEAQITLSETRDIEILKSKENCSFVEND
jgi:hypothetical protein